MTDIAALGLSVDSSGVVKATDDLDRFSASAAKAGRAADAPTSSTAKMGREYANAANKANQAASATNNYAGSSARAAAEARLAAAGVNTANMQWERASVALAKVAPAANQAAAGIRTATKAANDNAGAMKANTSNIAAQFQDIGVTAAMGMNPLMIGLQQGTQLSAALEGGLGNLANAFRQVLNPTSLLTIGIVALAAAGLQMVDWAELAKSALNGLADILVAIAPYAVAAAGALALIYSPAIIGGIAALTKGFVGLAASMIACLPIPVLIVAGLTAIVAAAIYFRDQLTQYLGFDIVQAAKDGVNYIIGFFVGGYKGIVAAWSLLPRAIGDYVIQAANATLRGVESMVNGTIGLINGLTSSLPFGLGDSLNMGDVSFGEVANPYAGALKDVHAIMGANIQAAQSFDYVGAAIDGVRGLAGKAADALRDMAASIGEDDKKKKGGKSAKDKAKEVDEWAKLLTDAAKQQRDLEQAGARVGQYGIALAQLTYDQELFNKAQDAGLKLTDAQAQKLGEIASDLAAANERNRQAEFFEDQRISRDEAIAALDRERIALGLTGEALIAYNYQQDRYAEYASANIPLTQERIDLINQEAAAHAKNRVQVDEQRKAMKALEEAHKFAQDTVSSFFTSFIDRAREGGNVFKALADSVINSLNRIADRLLDKGLESLFGGGGGGLGGIGKLLGIGGGSTTQATGVAMNLSGFANGGAFGIPHKFAKGGDFTNSIVSSPTLFRFAKGGKLGEMGEAGPEAIMPLKRGADGSLGVQMHGGGGGPQRVQVEITDTTGLFETRVAGQIATNAPVIIDAADRTAQSSMARRQSRRLA